MESVVKPLAEAVRYVSSPLGVVAFAIVCCTGALSVGAAFAVRHDKFAFMWVIHAFLAVFGIFGLVVVFCPSAFLTADERIRLAQANIQLPGAPWLVLLSAAALLITYMIYWGELNKKLIARYAKSQEQMGEPDAPEAQPPAADGHPRRRTFPGEGNDGVGTTSPDLRAAFMEIVDNQLTSNEPPETRETLHRLTSQGISNQEARICIGQAVCVEVWDIVRNKKGFNRDRFVRNLNGLPEEPKE